MKTKIGVTLGMPRPRDGSRERVQGVHSPPPPRDEAFFFLFAFKICLSHRLVTSFLRGAPLLRKILDLPLGPVNELA